MLIPQPTDPEFNKQLSEAELLERERMQEAALRGRRGGDLEPIITHELSRQEDRLSSRAIIADNLYHALSVNPELKEIAEDIQDRYGNGSAVGKLSFINRNTFDDENDPEQFLDVMKEFNLRAYGSEDTDKGPFATKAMNGQPLPKEELLQKAQLFADTIIQNKERSDYLLTEIAENQITRGGVKNDERYKVLEQQFNNPELLKMMSPDTYEIIQNIKQNEDLSDEEKLQEYFRICDTNAVEQGVLKPEEAKYYLDSQYLNFDANFENHYGVGNNPMSEFLKTLLQGQDALRERYGEPEDMQISQVNENFLSTAESVVQQAQEIQLPSEQQEQLNRALNEQMNGGEQLEAAAQRYTQDNSMSPDNTPSMSNDLRNRQQHSMRHRPSR